MITLSPTAEKNLKNFTSNELIVLPGDGEFGFQDYLNRKTENLIRKKRLSGAVEDHQILLSYPGLNSETEVFRRFFESADIKARGGHFSGCFAIDVTDYMNITENVHFEQLMNYIETYKGVHFMLLVFSANKEKVEAFRDALLNWGLVDVLEFGYPKAAELAEHIVSTFYAYNDAEPDFEIVEDIVPLLKSKKREYDYADRVVNELINRECSTDPEELVKVLSEILERKEPKASKHSFGFGK